MKKKKAVKVILWVLAAIFVIAAIGVGGLYYYWKCNSWKRKYEVDVVYSDFWNDLDRKCSIGLSIYL